MREARQFSSSFSSMAGSFVGFVLEEPRMVPPLSRMPEIIGPVISTKSPSTRPRQPRRMPSVWLPRWKFDAVTARMTAFRPGQSPPPVNTPSLISRVSFC